MFQTCRFSKYKACDISFNTSVKPFPDMRRVWLRDHGGAVLPWHWGDEMSAAGAQRCDIFKVARQCGVRLYDRQLHSPTSRKPFDCFCKPTLRKIGRAYGEDHLKLVFMLMTGTRCNASELYADMITAVSHLLVVRPELPRRPTLVTDFNEIDLGALRRRSKVMRLGIEDWKVLAAWLAVRFYQPVQGDLLDILDPIGEAA
jgi:hypothetical protein